MKTVWMLTIALATSGSLFAQTGYADLVEEIQDAIVNIRTTQTVESRRQSPFDFFNQDRGGQQEANSAGSGFLISADGFIVTNRHVVEDADEVTVFTLDQEEHKAKVIGTDENLDVALLKIEGRNFTHMRLGDSKKIRIGDPVLAVGYPLQLGFSVTSGIVSGIGRNMQTSQLDLATYIQTDADITFGNSGGPLINTRGEVIAINTMILSRGETYGFAIPTELFEPSIRQLRRFGEVRRGALGVNVANLNPEAMEYFKTKSGALITGVTRGLPAQKAGIKSDQVILAVDGDPVQDSTDLIAKVARKAPGQEIVLSLVDTRGRKFDKTVKLTDRRRLGNPDRRYAEEENEPEEATDIPLGFSVVPLGRDFVREMGLESDLTGVLVESVKRGSIAERNGIAANQIITEINHEKVRSPKDILRLLEAIPDRQVFPVRVVTAARNGLTASFRERTIFLREK